jgi:hypothetical protein
MWAVSNSFAERVSFILRNDSLPFRINGFRIEGMCVRCAPAGSISISISIL